MAANFGWARVTVTYAPSPDRTGVASVAGVGAVTAAGLTPDGNFITTVGVGVAASDVGVLAGSAVLTTVVAEAPADGGVSSMSVPGGMTSVVGTAVGAGGSTAFSPIDSAIVGTVAAAPAAGGSGSMDGDVGFVGSTADLVADGGVTDFVVPATFTTLVGSAPAAGGSSAFSAFSEFATSVGTSAATGGSTDFVIPATFITGAGNAFSGGGSTFFATNLASFVTTAPLSTLTNTPLAYNASVDYSITGYTYEGTVVGYVAASGRQGSMHGTPLLSPQRQLGTTYADVSLSPDPFQDFVPELVSQRTSQFELEPWRVVEGIPVASARYSISMEASASLGERALTDPFFSPGAVEGFAAFRWLADDYVTGSSWLPTVSGVQFVDVRTWNELRADFTWRTLSYRSWAQALDNTADPDAPSLIQVGAVDAALATDYTYWRSGEYVANPAVNVRADTAMDLLWNLPADPDAQPKQVTMAVVLVPHAPDEGFYEVLAARSDIRVVLNADSTLDLLYGGQMVSTMAIGARARPDEPIVIALSVFPLNNEGTSTVLYMAVMDTMVRVTSAQMSNVTIPSLSWTLASDQSSKFEILEACIYTDMMNSSQLAAELAIFDRIYGVTVT